MKYCLFLYGLIFILVGFGMVWEFGWAAIFALAFAIIGTFIIVMSFID